MTIEEAFQWIKEHNHELTEPDSKGALYPTPVRRVEILRRRGKLGIPTWYHPTGNVTTADTDL